MSYNPSRDELLNTIVGGQPRPFKETGGPQHNYDTENQPEPETKTWGPRELQECFTVQAFAAPLVLVTCKGCGRTGTLEFKHSPRVYFNFVPDPDPAAAQHICDGAPRVVTG